jgi:hypothetical protein
MDDGKSDWCLPPHVRQLAKRGGSCDDDSLGYTLTELVTPSSRLNVISMFDLANESTKNLIKGVYENHFTYCRERRLKHMRTKAIANGNIIFVQDPNGRYFVIKQQRVDRPSIDWEVTPGASFCELKCMFQLNFLMSSKGVGPFYVPLLEHGLVQFAQAKSFVLSTEMPQFSVTLRAWLTTPDCSRKPKYATSADASAAWIYTPGGGRALATSTFESDRALFNSILRSALFHIWLGLAHAQRYMCFGHNDLHSLNVMLNHTMVSGAKTYFTGFGTFRVPKGLPTAVIIDYQLASFDAWDSKGVVRSRMNGHRYSCYNGSTCYYDVWRLSTNLVLDALRELWGLVDHDVREHLWRNSQFAGDAPTCTPSCKRARDAPTPTADAFPTLTDEMQWCPYLLSGVLPEQALMDPCFACFRSTPQAAVQNLYVERADDEFTTDHMDVRFFARAWLTPHSPEAVKRVFADVLFVPQEGLHALGQLLETFGRNYAGNLRGIVASMCRHSVASRARFAYMEIEALQIATHWFYKQLAREDMNALTASATLDAVLCVMHSSFDWCNRPQTPEFEAYHLEVRAQLMRDEVRAVARRPKPAVPVHFVCESVVALGEEGQLAKFEPMVAQSLQLSSYTSPPWNV